MPIKIDDAISTSYDVTNSFYGRQWKQFSAYFLLATFRCHSFNAVTVLKGGGGRICPSPPRFEKEKTNPRLNRVNPFSLKGRSR